jgi:glycosyltransferase involved in cell wall biosynthesis
MRVLHVNGDARLAGGTEVESKYRNDESSPLRILMVSDVPWQRELGAARGQIELAEEFERLGHTVEKFDARDAFGHERPVRWHRLFPLRFARRARRHVREHGHRFDVIEALPGDLPFTKRDLEFDGVLVSRSMGLYALYAEYLRFERATWPDRIPGTPIGRLLHRLNVQRWSAACRRSLKAADLVRVLNDDEAAYVRNTLGLGHKCVTLPDGVSAAFAEALARPALPADERLRRREVVFVGSWSLRKGAADWGQIIRQTRARVPDTTFRFLGTGRQPGEILREVDLQAKEGISVVPHFKADELPALLATATVGALPSYIEGCPFSVLEQLAAGLPTVAYDVPGTRAILGRLGRALMAPAGNTSRFAELLAETLTLDEGSYARLAAEGRAAVGDLRCSAIAEACLEAYESRLARQGGERDREPQASQSRFRPRTMRSKV